MSCCTYGTGSAVVSHRLHPPCKKVCFRKRKVKNIFRPHTIPIKFSEFRTVHRKRKPKPRPIAPRNRHVAPFLLADAVGRAPRHTAGMIWRGHHQQERRRAEGRVEGERKQVGEQQEHLVPTLAADLVQDAFERTLRSVGGSTFLLGRIRRLRINQGLELHAFGVASCGW